MLTRRNERRRPTIRRHPRRGAWIRTRISGSLERYTRLELVYADWQSAVLATGRIPRTYGAEYGSPTRLTGLEDQHLRDRKSTRLNSSHLGISYAVFCLKKKKTILIRYPSLLSTVTARHYEETPHRC